MLSQAYGRQGEKVTKYFAAPAKSGGGPPDSKTLARRWGAPLRARRSGEPGRVGCQPAARRGLRALPAPRRATEKNFRELRNYFLRLFFISLTITAMVNTIEIAESHIHL